MKYTVEIETKALHDVVYDATDKSMSEKELDELFLSLPEDIRSLAVMWGCNDTEVQDKVYEHLTSVVIDIETSGLPNSKPEIVGGCGIEYFATKTLFMYGRKNENK